jgi:hypothetical protein
VNLKLTYQARKRKYFEKPLSRQEATFPADKEVPPDFKEQIEL